MNADNVIRAKRATIVADLVTAGHIKAQICRKKALVLQLEAQSQSIIAEIASLQKTCPHPVVTRHSAPYDSHESCDFCGGTL